MDAGGLGKAIEYSFIEYEGVPKFKAFLATTLK
jgi:hypothetical protein